MEPACPTTGREVSTGIEIDPTSYRGLPSEFTEITCPVCSETHNLSNVQPRAERRARPQEV